MKPLAIPSPAKINLFLKVLGRRNDGYHDIETLMCRVTLFDTVGLAFNQPAITTRCSHPDVPEGRANLAHKAAALFLEAVSSPEGVAITIKKSIPVAAGLGGGSSNAAAVLMGLNQRHGFPLGNEALRKLGARLGADVPFFILGHSAIATGIGDKLEPFCGLPLWSVLLVCPKGGLSTAWVYKHLTLRLTKAQEDSKVLPFPEDPSKIKNFLCNDLEQVAIGKFPEIDFIKTALVDLGAEGALMSGSGPTVFGLFRDPQKASLAFQKMKQERRGDTYLVNLLVP
jgi:4-diphosphocytidyl-2-C-methyl-D-erythritol kinase